MAFENLIQLSFTAEELKKIDDSLAEIEKVLKGKMHNLTPEERKQYGSIAEQVEDTKKLLDFDNYQAALSFYRSVKILESENVPGVTTMLDDLKQFFLRVAKSKAVKSNPASENKTV